MTFFMFENGGAAMRMFLFVIGFFIFTLSAKAEPIPGDSCATYPIGSVMRSGGPELAGKIYVMTCKAGIWVEGEINPDCPNIGDICKSGMIYAGEFNGHDLYVAADDAPTTLTWGPLIASGMELCVTPPYIGGSCDTGPENTQLLNDRTEVFPAAEYCASLNAHAQDTGWYLPAKNELDVIYENLKAGKPAGTFNFQDVRYWSSSDYGGSYAWPKNFLDGKADNPVKASSYRVRCVRR